MIHFLSFKCHNLYEIFTVGFFLPFTIILAAVFIVALVKTAREKKQIKTNYEILKDKISILRAGKTKRERV